MLLTITTLRVMPEKHTAQNIYDKVHDICNEYGIDLDSVPIITDSASNMRSAFKKIIWLPCMCHRLHTAVECAWNNALEDPEFKLVYQKMLEVRAYIHRSANKSSKLPKKLPNDSPTRPWCGLSKLFEAFDSSYEILSELTQETKVTMPTDRPLIKQIGTFFQIFDQPFKSLQSTKKTTSYMVCTKVVTIAKKISELPQRLEVLKDLSLKCILFIKHVKSVQFRTNLRLE